MGHLFINCSEHCGSQCVFPNTIKMLCCGELKCLFYWFFFLFHISTKDDRKHQSCRLQGPEHPLKIIDDDRAYLKDSKPNERFVTSGFKETKYKLQVHSHCGWTVSESSSFSNFTLIFFSRNQVVALLHILNSSSTTHFHINWCNFAINIWNRQFAKRVMTQSYISLSLIDVNVFIFLRKIHLCHCASVTHLLKDILV